MKALVIGNWKMNPATFKDAKALYDDTKHVAGLVKKVDAVVAPPSVFLKALASGRRGRVAFAVQNAHFEAGGAHTGEISMAQARDAGASYVIIGHAERREMGETDDDVRKKVSAAISTGLTPVLCIGEKERGAGAEHFTFIRNQLRTALADVPEKKLTNVIIVYEPLWTIGQTTTMRPRDMHEMSIFVRKTVVEKFGEDGHKVAILYGGSVDATNAAEMLADGDVRGFLVGRASWKAESFAELLRAVSS